MDHRVEKINPTGSSPDTLIGQSSPEDDRKRQMTSFSAESLNTAASSSSSLETIVGVGMEAKKKGRFGSLKSSFRKEGGLFRMKKKKKKHFDDEPSHQYPHSEQSSKGYKEFQIENILSHPLLLCMLSLLNLHYVLDFIILC